MEILLIAVLAFAIGSCAGFFVWRKLPRTTLPTTQTLDAQLLLERIEKVFKIVMAEGYFTEIYSHDNNRSFWGLFNTNKKALIVAKAKVAIGYDFSKLKIRRDFESKTFVVEQFPEAEVIAIDTDYQFYDINQGFMNRFDHQDYTAILSEAKRLMQQKAMESDLPQSAQEQIQLLINQLFSSSGWELSWETPQIYLPKSEGSE